MRCGDDSPRDTAPGLTNVDANRRECLRFADCTVTMLTALLEDVHGVRGEGRGGGKDLLVTRTTLVSQVAPHVVGGARTRNP
jgi:hypothetical protein